MKLAVVLHSFYPELRPELDACLANLDEPYDLFVTEAGSENVGFDVWPFLRVLNGLDLSRYTHVLKLHTKRNLARPVVFNGMSVVGSAWRDWLLSIVRTPQAWAEAKRRLSDPDVGMVAAAECILDRRATESREERMMFDDALREGARRFGLPVRRFRGANFVGGTMFLAKSEALKPLQGRFAATDFAVSDTTHRSASFAHVAERLIGFSVAAAGLRIESPQGDLAARRRHFRFLQLRRAVARFLYQDRITARGRRLIKVCRIPVWNRMVRGDRT